MLSSVTFESIETVPLFVDQFVASWESAIDTIIAELPGIVGAILILAVGVYLGQLLGRAAERLARQVGLADVFAGSPIESFLGEDGSLSSAIGVIVTYYVVVFAAFVAVKYVGFAVLEEWLRTLVEYLPRAIAGLAVIVVGIVVAEYAADQTDASEAVQGSEYGPWVTAGVRAFLYFFAAVIGLDMLGLNLEIVYLIVDGLTSAIGLGITAAIALAVGVAAGYAAKEYAEERPRSDS